MLWVEGFLFVISMCWTDMAKLWLEWNIHHSWIPGGTIGMTDVCIKEKEIQEIENYKNYFLNIYIYIYIYIYEWVWLSRNIYEQAGMNRYWWYE